VLLAVLAVGCDDTRADDAGVVDAGGAEDGGASDAGADAGGPLTCEQMLMERRVALDLDGPRTQIHAAVAWDGEAIWVVYSRPDDDGQFDIYATRRGCDGAALTEPFAVQADPAGNDIDPAIAISGDTVLVAWTSDDGEGGTDNLQVFYRTFARDGTPTMDADAQLTTARMGAPITDNHSGVELAAAPGGGFWFVGARAVPDAMRFQAYAQRVDAAGALDGEAIEPPTEAMVTQSDAAIDVAPDGRLLLAYDRAPDDGDPEVRLTALDGDPPEVVVAGLSSHSGADVRFAGGAAWVAFAGTDGVETDLHIVDATAPLATRTARVLGEAGRLEHSPRLAAGPDAVAVAYFRQVRGFTNELLVASVTDDAVTPVVLETEVPAYQPAITHVMGRFWFVSYAIGESPDFRLVGRFVEL